MEPYPIKPTYHVRSYHFGERLIPRMLGKGEELEGTVAETWEVSDYRETTAKITNGSYAGRTLHDLVLEFPEELVGEGFSGPRFPLLVKLIDASRMLPVHLHADDETARRVHGEPNGKTEAWHILWAAEGATVLAGVKGDPSRGELREAVENQDYDAVMRRYEVRAGDTVYVPGGVIHTFGPDALVLEVQQTSDLGQLVSPEDLYGAPFDKETWEANIEAALDELRTRYSPRPHPGLLLEDGPNRRLMCCAGPHFALERWKLSEPYVEPALSRRFLTLTNVGEAVGIEHANGEERLDRGESCILPAAMEEARIVSEGESSLVACYVPDLRRDVIAPLREAGHSDREIQALGEV